MIVFAAYLSMHGYPAANVSWRKVREAVGGTLTRQRLVLIFEAGCGRLRVALLDRKDSTSPKSCSIVKGSAGVPTMLRVDGAYIYEFGAQMRPLGNIADGDTHVIDLYVPLVGAKKVLSEFVRTSVFSAGLRAAQLPAQELLKKIDQYISDDVTKIEWSRTIPGWEVTSLKNAFRKCEAVITAELQTAALYYVSAKGGFDTACLTDEGQVLFPSDLGHKVPGALADAKAGARCMAFDLPTAAGFHFHRATEAVLRAYFDEVAGKEHRPRSRNMGDYLKKMRDLKVGDAKVLDVLQSLKDLHRNPLMHPEDVIESADEAISLYAAVRAAIGYILDRIPAPPTAGATALVPAAIS